MKRLFLGTLCAAVTLGACADPIHITATTPTSVDSLTVFSLSGSDPSLPTGLDILARQPVRIDGFGAFDIAFDILSPTEVRILPVALVVTSPAGSRAVGLGRATGFFVRLLEAPRPDSAYELDSALVTTPGQLILVRTTRAGPGDLCQYAISPFIYAKLMVTDIDVEARTVSFLLGVDPNCGFRSFNSGIPAF